MHLFLVASYARPSELQKQQTQQSKAEGHQACPFCSIEAVVSIISVLRCYGISFDFWSVGQKRGPGVKEGQL